MTERIARVQMPDGRIARISVPEGTTPEQVESFAFNMQEPPATRSTGREIGRQVGLTGRYLVEGATGIPNAIGDAVGLRSSETVSNLLTKAGLPSPEGEQERVVADVARAMAGQGGTFKLGAKMMTSSGPAAKSIGELLTMRPDLQLVGAAGSAGASGATREGGGGTIAQWLAGLAGGLAAPGAWQLGVEGLKAGGRSIAALVKPFTSGGREEIVGTTLDRAATNPATAARNMANAEEFVPGSAPTAAQASRDPGLLTAERAVRSTNSRFAEQASKANEARNILLASMAGDETALNAAKSARTTQGNALYAKSFGEKVNAPSELSALATRPAFEQAVKRASSIAAEEGVDLGNPMETMRGLHYVKMALDDIIENATSRADSGIGRTQGRAMMGTRDALLKVMDDISPAYREARASFKEASKPVNQMEALQDVQKRVLNAGTDAQTGERIMSASKFYQSVTKNEADLAKVLTPEQMTGLRSIAKDLDRGALSDTAGRAAGSNTFQNISTAYLLGQALGGKAAASPALQTMMRPLAWLTKLPDAQMQELLTDAMLNPALARSLMAKAAPQRIESIGFELAQRAKALGIGAAQGTVQSSGKPLEPE